MSSPRNYIFLLWQPALSGNGQSANCKPFSTINSLGSYHYFFNTKAQNPKFKIRPRQRPSFYFRNMLATITSSIPKLKIQISAAPAPNFMIFANYSKYLIPISKTQISAAPTTDFEFRFLIATNIFSYQDVIHCFYPFTSRCV